MVSPVHVSQYDPVHPKDSPMIRCGSELTFCRARLVEAAEENIRIASTGKYINEKGDGIDVSQVVENAIQNSIHYDISHTFSIPENSKKIETSISVILASSLTGVAILKRDGAEHVGVLNSASSKNPGGTSLKGTLSLESCLCRGSLLLPCLAKFESTRDKFYKISGSAKYSSNPSCCAIFSPNVPIIREDSMEAALLDNYEICSFVSIPAPNAFLLGNGQNASEALRNATYDRLFRALCILLQQGCTDLVLCAIGCRSHSNSPNMVAEVFDDLLSNAYKNRFNKVIFAINPKNPATHTIFKSILQK